MSASGQLGISYTYDNANRLTQITQGTAVATIAYDNANRRTAVTLPNGAVMTYGYNAASDLTNLTWTKNGNPLGNLTYTYDQYGRMTQMGGTFARENLPAALSSASYNAANQLTQWGGSTLTYDLNGNLTSDGTHSYTWNARNQLAGGYLQYDALGRRMRNPAGTSFLYDGLNPIQELSGSTITANLLTGLGIDEIFSRQDFTGTYSFLTDRLGSTAALSDSTGTLQTQYTYAPFGATTTTGLTSTNPYQFTGRENDGWLYYNRARYYSPTFQRFISEDPVGFGGGDTNLYGYTADDPVDFVDPSGMDKKPQGCSVGSAGRSWGQYLYGLGSTEMMFDQFLTGMGPSDLTFGQGSVESQMMASSPGVTNAVSNYLSSGLTSGTYTFGLSGLVAAGANPIQQFVGSYSYSITPANGGLNVTLSNYTSVRSGSYHLLGSHQRSSFGPMGTTHQTYQVFVPCHN